MKTNKIILILVIIGLGLLLTQNIWVPKLMSSIPLSKSTPTVVQTEPTTTLVNLSDNQRLASMGISCTDSLNYFVISKSLNVDVGSDILVKYKTSKNQNFLCKYEINAGDFEIKNEWAEYLLAITNNFLIIDSGTSPDPRGLIIYDLNIRKKVYTDEYFEQSIMIKNNLVDYWSPTDQKTTTLNCPKLDEYQYDGLGAGIDSHVVLDLSNLSKKELGEYRCTPRQ